MQMATELGVPLCSLDFILTLQSHGLDLAWFVLRLDLERYNSLVEVTGTGSNKERSWRVCKVTSSRTSFTNLVTNIKQFIWSVSFAKNTKQSSHTHDRWTIDNLHVRTTSVFIGGVVYGTFDQLDVDQVVTQASCWQPSTLSGRVSGSHWPASSSVPLNATHSVSRWRSATPTAAQRSDVHCAPTITVTWLSGTLPVDKSTGPQSRDSKTKRSV